MTQQQLLILSFFDAEIGRVFTDKDLTSEMKEAGIGTTEGSDFPYYDIIHFLQTNQFIIPYKDPSKNGRGLTYANRTQLYVLSEIASQILNRDNKRKEHQEYVSELEFNKLKTEYGLLYNQLSDYDETKAMTKKSYKISVWSIIVAIVSALAAVTAIIITLKKSG